MKLTNEFQPIRHWAAERGIYDKGDPNTQLAKLGEEFGELCKSLIEQNPIDFRDAIGDMVVVLTSLAYMKGFYIESCINEAYEEIKDRKGNMENGTFIKE